MKLKAAVRYQVTNLLALLLVFSGIIGALLIMGNIVATSSGGVFVASGISTLGFGFIGILAFTTCEGDLRVLLQNGLTRAQVRASCASFPAERINLCSSARTACARTRRSDFSGRFLRTSLSRPSCSRWRR